MSKSYRKTPILGNAGSSEKKDKQRANRKFRRIVKTKLTNEYKFGYKYYSELAAFNYLQVNVHQKEYSGETLNLKVREVSDVWDFSKDGKHYWSLEDAKRLDASMILYIDRYPNMGYYYNRIFEFEKEYYRVMRK